MIIELTEEEISVLKPIIEIRLGWLKYKTKYSEINYDDRMLKDIEILALLMEKFA